MLIYVTQKARRRVNIGMRECVFFALVALAWPNGYIRILKVITIEQFLNALPSVRISLHFFPSPKPITVSCLLLATSSSVFSLRPPMKRSLSPSAFSQPCEISLGLGKAMS